MTTATELNAKNISRRDCVFAAALGILVAGFHFLNGYPLATSVLLQSFNWVFDFDSSRHVKAWGVPGVDVSDVLSLSFVTRHPLSPATRPLGLALNLITGDPYVAVMALTALCAGCVATIAYFLAAQFCENAADRLLLALGFSVSSQPLLLGVIPETYGFALAGIGLHMVLVARNRDLLPAATPWWVLSLVLNAGITVTNGALNLLSSAVLAWKRMLARDWLTTELRKWVVAGIALAILVVPCVALFEPAVLADAGSVPKRLWWTVNINRGESAGLARVIAALAPYGFVAPDFTIVDLPDDGHPMLDFREFRYSYAGGLALLMWFAGMSAGIYAALCHKGLRRILVIVLLWTLINIVLHWYWQFRGSIYLYGAHTSFPLFVLLIIAYASAIQRYSRSIVRTAAAIMVSLTAYSNVSTYSQMIDFLIAQAPVPAHLRTPSN